MATKRKPKKTTNGSTYQLEMQNGNKKQVQITLKLEEITESEMRHWKMNNFKYFWNNCTSYGEPWNLVDDEGVLLVSWFAKNISTIMDIKDKRYLESNERRDMQKSDIRLSLTLKKVLVYFIPGAWEKLKGTQGTGAKNDYLSFKSVFYDGLRFDWINLTKNQISAFDMNIYHAVVHKVGERIASDAYEGSIGGISTHGSKGGWKFQVGKCKIPLGNLAIYFGSKIPKNKNATFVNMFCADYCFGKWMADSRKDVVSINHGKKVKGKKKNEISIIMDYQGKEWVGTDKYNRSVVEKQINQRFVNLNDYKLS
eukprot:136803_1